MSVCCAGFRRNEPNKQVIHYLRESNKAIQTQIMLHGERDRRVISSVFKDDKPLRLELQRKQLHQAIDITFDKYCVSQSYSAEAQ